MDAISKLLPFLDRLPTIRGISPKVYGPFVLIILATTLHGLSTGEWNAPELLGYALALLQLLTGIAPAPAPGVSQETVNKLSEHPVIQSRVEEQVGVPRTRSRAYREQRRR
jgi:hypothetical protein